MRSGRLDVDNPLCFNALEDETGALVPGATVTISSSALIGERTAVSNNSGAYRFPSIPPGEYTVEVKLQGFQT